MKYLIGFILLLFLLPHCSNGSSRGGIDFEKLSDTDQAKARLCQDSGGSPIGEVSTTYYVESTQITQTHYFKECAK